jgi:hypothetical protein
LSDVATIATPVAGDASLARETSCARLLSVEIADRVHRLAIKAETGIALAAPLQNSGEGYMQQAQAVATAPLRLNSSIKGLVLIYGLTIVSCFIVNLVVKAMPIGPWSGEQIDKFFWLDNVTWQLLGLWWALLSIVSGGWPFNGIQSGFTRGIVIIAASWIMGWLSAKSIYWSGLGADWIFPIVGCIFFSIAFFSFTGENWIVAGMPPHRQFFILLILIAFCTYVVTNSAVRWIPAWWFPFVQMGAATGLLAYWTRGMKQPGRGFTQIAILFLTVLICLFISRYLGLWDSTKAGVGNFWSIGYFTDDQYWLLWFMRAPQANSACRTGHNGRLALQNTQFTLLLLLHAFMFSRPNSSRGLRRDVGLAVGGSRARPCQARASGRPVCESRIPPRELADRLRVPTHAASDGAPQARSTRP